jgi:predicted MFS family arabinose efflux permease
MAIATGSIVANLYYLQPLLHQVVLAFGVHPASATLLLTLTQAGYAVGLAFVVPLGDLVPRRKLVVVIFLVAALLMVAGAIVPSFAGFAIITALVGLASVGGQVMIPLAADFAEPTERARVVARLMSGLLLGILLSRTVSGYLADFFGWRSVYWVAGGLMALFALLLASMLPSEPVRPHIAYPSLVAGSVRFLATMPELRRRAWLGAMGFGAFSVLWSTLAFLLSAPPYRFSNGTIGAFGLIGVAGVLAANAAGSLADSKRTRELTVAAGILLTGSFAILAFGGASLWAVVVGVIVLDIAVQGLQITNQSIIYKLAPDARSRINSAYMVCYFFGGALGSILGGVAWGLGKWPAVTILGAGFGVAALLPGLWWSRNSTPTPPTPSVEIA